MREYLRKLRREAGLTQQELARALGISQNSYSYIENGKRQKNMQLALAVRLASALSTKPDDLWKAEAEYQRALCR